MIALFLGITAAFARPAPPTPVPEAVAAADIVVIAQPISVEFEWLADKEILESSTLGGFLKDYRVLEVLRGPATVGQVFRMRHSRAGCFQHTRRIQRRGEHFVQLGEDGTTTPLLAADELGGPQILLIETREGEPFHAGRWQSPRPATVTHRGEVEEALNR